MLVNGFSTDVVSSRLDMLFEEETTDAFFFPGYHENKGCRFSETLVPLYQTARAHKP
jgi:hypothetical protein